MNRIIPPLSFAIATLLAFLPGWLHHESLTLRQDNAIAALHYADTLKPEGVYNVFRYQPPEFFTKTESAEKLEFSMRNNDTSFCRINLYPAGKAGRDSIQELKTLWSNYVHKAFGRADSLPVNIMSGNKIDGWQSALGLGNCYVGGKKCVMMLFSYRRDTLMAFSTALMSERIFKPPVESFYQSLHLQLPPKKAAAKKVPRG